MSQLCHFINKIESYQKTSKSQSLWYPMLQWLLQRKTSVYMHNLQGLRNIEKSCWFTP